MAISSSPAESDLIEMIIEDEIISFSRSLLMQSSHFFRNTFKDGQAKKKRVVVSGVSGQTFKDLLGYMKTGELELSCNNVADIFHAACKLQMPGIISQCIEMEAQTSPIGRQIILFKTSKRMNISDEKSSAFHHLVSNFTLVAVSQEFLELDLKDVCELLSSDILGCQGEMDVFTAACHWISHKANARMAHASKLMQCVRFPQMSLMELNQCLEATTPPGLSEVCNVRVMILSAICFWVAKVAGKETEVSHLARKARRFCMAAEKLSSEVPCNQTPLTSKRGGKERSLFEDIVSRESKNQAGTISTVGWKSSTLSSGSNTTKVTLHARASEELEAKGTNSMAFSGSYPWSQNDSKSKHIQRLEDSSSCSFSHNSSNKSTKNEGGDCKRMVLPAYQKASEEPSKSNKAKTHLVFQGREVKPSMTYAQEMCKPYETLQKSAVASTSVQTECSASEILDKNKVEQGTLFLIGGTERGSTELDAPDCPILSYDMKSNTWSSRKTLPVHRYGHKAVYLNDHIYIVGGFENFSPINLEKTSSRCCFWYEVSSGQWGIMAPLNCTRAYHGLAVLRNTIYVVGGVDSNNRLLGSLEYYNKEKDEWIKLSNELYSPRMAMGTCGHKGQLWVAGGIVQIGRRTCSTAYVEVYNPISQRWSFAVNFLPSPRSCLTMIECNGVLYAIGGLLSHRSGKRRSFTTVEDMLMFVDDRNAWVDKAPMPMARHSVITATHDGVVFVLGGRQAESPEYRFDSILAFDTKLNRWLSLGSVPRNLIDYHCVLVAPKRPSECLRDLLTSRGDHRLASKITSELPSVGSEIKSYSQGDVAVKRIRR